MARPTAPTVQNVRFLARSRALKLSAAVLFSAVVGGAAMPAQAQTRGGLGLKLPELKLTGNSLSDAIDFLRDVSGANIHVNWRALEAAGVNKDTPVNLRLRDVPLRRALTLLLNEAGGGVALTYFSDEGVIEVTTKELADKEMFTRVYSIDDLIVDIPDFTNAPNFDLSAISSGGSGSNGSSGGGGRSGGSSGSSGSGSGNIFNQSSNTTTEKVKSKTERGEEIVALIREVVAPEVWRDNGGPASIRYFNGSIIVTGPRSVHDAIAGR